MKQPFHGRFFLDALCERKRPSANGEKSVCFPIYPTPLPYALVVDKYPAVYRGSENRLKRKSTFIEMRLT